MLGVIVALLLMAGGGVAYEVGQYQGPANAVTRFCGSLKTQRYAATYALLSPGPRARYAEGAYTQFLAQLDTLEGTVTACGQAAGGGAYQYRLGASSATVMVALSRARHSTLRGELHLVNASGEWRVAEVDTSLLGVNPEALQVANAYCHALLSQNYKTAFGLLSAAARDEANAAQFQYLSQTQDQVNGKVRACAPIGLGVTNTDTTAQLVLGITRARLAQRKGALDLSFAKASWMITTLDPQLQGTSLGALLVAIRWCGDINAGNYADAYSISVAKSQVSLAQFQDTFDGPQTIQGQTFYFQWTVCKADPTTYSVSGTSATITAAATWVVTVNGQALSQNYTVPLEFTEVGTTWLWYDVGTPTPVA